MKYGERLARDIPDAQLVRIRNARHFVMLDQPGDVAEQLLGFLRGGRRDDTSRESAAAQAMG